MRLPKSNFKLPKPHTTIEEVEKQMILDRLNDLQWNITYSAKTLGISRATLHRKINRYSLSKDSV